MAQRLCRAHRGLLLSHGFSWCAVEKRSNEPSQTYLHFASQLRDCQQGRCQGPWFHWHIALSSTADAGVPWHFNMFAYFPDRLENTDLWARFLALCNLKILEEHIIMLSYIDTCYMFYSIIGFQAILTYVVIVYLAWPFCLVSVLHI